MSSGLSARARAATLLLVTAALIGAADPAPAAPVAWEEAALPPEARVRIHRTTAALPPFPQESPAMLDPAKWPASLGDSLGLCRLDLSAWQRSTPIPLRSAAERKPGQALSARYLCIARGWRAPRYMGPRYAWTSQGWLEERSYRDTDGTRYSEDLWQYRANGLVWAFRHRERNEDEGGSSLSLDEYFEPDGSLAGFQLVRVDTTADSTSSRPDTVATRWWRGVPLDAERFKSRTSTFAKSD